MGITRIRADADVPPFGLHLKLLPVSLATFGATSPLGRLLTPTFISDWKRPKLFICRLHLRTSNQPLCLAHDPPDPQWDRRLGERRPSPLMAAPPQWRRGTSYTKEKSHGYPQAAGATAGG